MKNSFSKNITIKIILSMIALLALVVMVVVLVKTPDSKAKVDGEITFVLIGYEEEELINEKLGYQKGETIFVILNRNYRLKYEDSIYGHVIYGIEGVYANFNETSYYLAIYINNEYAQTGIDQLTFQDGDVIRFEVSQ